MRSEDEIARTDCVELLKPGNVETIWVAKSDSGHWQEYLSDSGFVADCEPHVGVDAVVAPFSLDLSSRREMMIAVDEMARTLRPYGLAYVLFGPYNPDLPSYKDNELRATFSVEFKIEIFRSYPGGLRGLLLKKKS